MGVVDAQSHGTMLVEIRFLSLFFLGSKYECVSRVTEGRERQFGNPAFIL